MRTGTTFRLVARRGLQPEVNFTLNEELVTLGRDPRNDIVINDPEISRRHARFIWLGSGYGIEDMGSINGTFVNNERVQEGERKLTPGDAIALGDAIELIYYEEPAD